MIHPIPNAGALQVALDACRGLISFHRRQAVDTILEMQGGDEIAASRVWLMRMGADYHLSLARKVEDDIVSAEGLVKAGHAQRAYEFLKGKRYA